MVVGIVRDIVDGIVGGIVGGDELERVGWISYDETTCWWMY